MATNSNQGANKFVFDIAVNYKTAIDQMAQLQEKLDDLKDAAKGAKKRLAITQDSDQYRKDMQAIEQATKRYKEELRLLQKETANQIKYENEQKGSLAAMRAELSRCTQQYDRMSKAERESAKGNDLKKHINDITKELKDAETATERYYRNVGNYKNSILEAIGVNGTFGNSIVAMASNANGISGMMSAATTSVKAFSAACLGLLSNPIVMAIAGIAGAGVAFKWWFDYNKGLAEATRLTREFTGETGAALENIVSSVQATADTFGKDYLEVLQTMDGLMAQFHISSDEAMKVINNGFAAGADLSGNFLANISQYAPIFKDAGLKADEMVAIIAQTRSGIFSQGGLDAIAMASKRIREMASGTKESLKAIGLDAEKIEQELSSGMVSTFDVIQQISSKMKEFGNDSSEVGNIIKDVFGKQGAANGIEMLEMLDEMTVDIEKVKEVTGEYGALQLEQLDIEKQLEAATMDLFAVQDGGFEAVLMKCTNFIKKGLLWMINVFRDARTYWTSFTKKYDTSMAAASLTTTSFGKTVRAIFRDIVESGKLLAKALGNLFELDFDAAQKNFEAGMNKLKNSFKGKFDELMSIRRKYADDMEEIDKEMYKSLSNYQGEDGSSSGGNGGKGGGNSGGNADSGKGSGRSKRGGKSATQKTTTKKDTNDALKAAKEAQKAMEDAQKELEQMRKTHYEQVVAMYDAQLKVVVQGSEEQKRIELEKLDTVYQHERQIAQETILNEEVKQATLLAMQQKYAADRFAIIQNAAEQELEERQKAADEQFAALENQERLHSEQTEAVELARLMLQQELANQRIAARQSELEQLATIEGLSAEQRAERQKEINEQIKADQQALADAQVDIEVAKDKAISSAMGSLGQAMQDFASENTAFAKMGKVLALGELAINTGKALSSGISSAMSLPFPANLAAMATTIATVLANIATAKKTIQSAKFATGGLVEGAGTGTSDSISARLSNGESVINARSTGMFAPLLSSINQMGGGVPISMSQTSNQAMGEEMLARAVAKGVAAIQPVVSVEEINKVNNRVQALETLGSL